MQSPNDFNRALCGYQCPFMQDNFQDLGLKYKPLCFTKGRKTLLTRAMNTIVLRSQTTLRKISYREAKVI